MRNSNTGISTQTKTIAALQGLEMEIAELDSGAFKNDDMRNLLLNKLYAVIANVEAGKHADAANQLRNDILPKMGSAENAEGDKGDWIVSSRSQRILYRAVHGDSGDTIPNYCRVEKRLGFPSIAEIARVIVP